MDRAARIGRAFGGVWLLFLAYPIAGLFAPQVAPLTRWFGLLGAALFAALYLWLIGANWYSQVQARHYLALGGLAVLAAAAAVVLGSDALPVFIFVTAAAGSVLGPGEAVLSAAGLTVVVLLIGITLHADLGASVLFAAETGLIGVSMIGVRRLIETIRELRAAREEIARLAVADERVRFARDLHDLLGHSLSVITLKSELAGRLLPGSPERAADEVRDIERVAREALQEVREAVTGYRQTELWREVDTARQALGTAGIECTYTAETSAVLPADIQAVLAWAVREGAINVVRHSGAAHCAIRLAPGQGSVTLEVTDDGRGDALGSGGNGLRGLTERALARGGRVEAGPRREGGYRLAVSLPVPEPSPAPSEPQAAPS